MKNINRMVLRAFLVLFVLVSACTSTATSVQETPSDAATAESKSVLNIHNWADYIDESILAGFEEKFGVTINYTTFTSNEDLINELLAGPVDYDLVVPTDYAVELLRKKGVFGAIDKANVPNFANIDPTFINPSYDPGNRYCIPYQWGTIGIGYNVTATGTEIQGWSDIFDPAFAGRVALLDEPRVVLGAILLYLGHSPNTTNQIEIIQAAEFLKLNAGHVASYLPDTGQDSLAAGEVDIVMEWSGDIFTIMADNADIRYVIPNDGTIIWSDNVCLLANAPNKENAEKFMNYLLNPEVSAALSNYLRYATPNEAALPFINQEDRDNPGMYPSDEVKDRLFFLTDVGSTAKDYTDAWADVIANHGQ